MWQLSQYNIINIVLNEVMAAHSSTLAWKIPWTKEPGRLQSMGVAKSWTRLSNFTFTFHFHALEKEFSVLAWRIPGTGAWWAAVCGVAQSRTWLKRLSSSSKDNKALLTGKRNENFGQLNASLKCSLTTAPARREAWSGEAKEEQWRERSGLLSLVSLQSIFRLNNKLCSKNLCGIQGCVK